MSFNLMHFSLLEYCPSTFFFFAALYHVVPCITAVKQTIIRAIKKSRPKENEFFFKLTFSCSTSNSKSNTFITGLP